MTILERALSKMQQLPMEQQQQALRFIEFLAWERPEQELPEQPRISPRDVLKKWEGAVEGGVEDMSTNPKYMEGYGQK
jgi:hypothetical protein